MRESGNACLRFIQQFFNFFLILFGFALIGLGIYVWYYTKVANFVNVIFFIIGSLQIVIGIIAIKSAKSKAKITCYLFFLGAILLVQFIVSVVGLADKNILIEKAIEAQKDSGKSIEALDQLIRSNLNVAMWVSLACFLVQLFSFIFMCWYRDSMIDRNIVADNDDFEVQNALIKKQAAEKRANNQKKLENEHPEYYKWKQQQSGK